MNTIKTCEPDEDMCLSEISWGCKIIIYIFLNRNLFINKFLLQLLPIGWKEELNNITYQKNVLPEPRAKQ